VARLLGIGRGHESALAAGLRRGIPTALPGAVRASAGLGTTADDVDRLVDAVTRDRPLRAPMDLQHLAGRH
jgi:selenocysteine lyase/cysteine desulfurase